MRRIALFIGELKQDYQHRLASEISKQAKEKGISLDIFANFGVYGSNLLFAYGEKSLVNLPSYKEYDAVIVVPDTFSLVGYEEALFVELKNIPDTPVISVRKEMEWACNVLIDDYTSICNMVEHLILKHGYKKIGFVKGKEDLNDSKIRFQAFKDTMEKHGLPIKEEYCFQGNYWVSTGKPAVKHYTDLDELPEAIVCANDWMAISITNEFEKIGIKVPEDVAIVGYDNVEDSYTNIPTISTAGVFIPDMALNIFKIIEKLWNGTQKEKNEYVPSVFIPRESCGCDVKEDKTTKQRLLDYKNNLMDVATQASFLYINLANCKTFEEMLYNLPINLIAFDFLDNFYICLNDPEECDKRVSKTTLTEHMILKGIVDKKGAKVCNLRFDREDILPVPFKKDTTTVAILHIQDEVVGYVAVDNMIDKQFAEFFQLFLQGIVNWYDKYRVCLQNCELQEEVEYDALTKIPNRKFIDRIMNETYMKLVKEGKPFFVCSIDMDGLKQINDTFGHPAGDKAIKTTANIINNTTKKLGYAARLGGDEFLVCYPTSDEEVVKKNIEKMEKSFAKYNKTHDLPYEISVSIGYKKCEKGMILTDCILAADKQMYEIKRKNNKNRK